MIEIWNLPRNETAEIIFHPWKHWIIRDLIPESTIAEINSSWPPLRDRRWNSKKKEFSFKSHISDIRRISYPANEVILWLNSKPFLSYLSSLTGIPNLLADETLEGGGLHNIRAGGYLKTHIDFNRLDINGWYRRLNLLVYLNEVWEEKWGGYLSLYARDPENDNEWYKTPEASYAPVAGTSILFETTEESFHGHPEPLACPKSITRRSIAIYYYTKEPPKELSSLPPKHNTVYFIDKNEEFKKKYND